MKMLTVKQLEKKILQEEMMTVHVEVVKSIKNVVEDNFGGPKC